METQKAKKSQDKLEEGKKLRDLIYMVYIFIADW